MTTEQDAGGGAGPAALFARTWRLTGSAYPDRSALDDLVDVLLPQFESLEGYRGGNILVDRDNGDIFATTFWDSMDHLRAAQSRAANAAAGTLVIADASAMEVSVCDVLVSTPVPRLVNRDLPAPHEVAPSSTTGGAGAPRDRGGEDPSTSPQP